MPGPAKPAAIRIRLPHASVQEFAEGYRHHVSRSGVFVVTDMRRSIGSILGFEFVLATGTPLLRGEAVVAPTPLREPRAGMLLRFLSLDVESQGLIDRLCPPEQPSGAVGLGIDLGTSALRAALTIGGLPEALPEAGWSPQSKAPQDSVSGASGREAELALHRPSSVGLTRPDWVPPSTVAGFAQLLTSRLAFLRLQASARAGCSVRRAVISVPSDLGEIQRAALRSAARGVGLEIDRLVSSAMAVALTHAIGKSLPRRRLIVLNLGAGNFDCSIVQVEGDALATLAHGTAVGLGGWQFDARLAGDLARRLAAETGGTISQGAGGWQRLVAAAERAKVALSAETSTNLQLLGLPLDDGRSVDFGAAITRDQFEGATADLLRDTERLVQAVLATRGCAARACDDLLLVGGMSAMPALRRSLAGVLGRAPLVDAAAGSPVANGAALLADGLGRRDCTLEVAEDWLEGPRVASDAAAAARVGSFLEASAEGTTGPSAIA